MSLTTDNVRASATPNVWKIRNLTLAGALMGVGELLLCTAVLAYGRYSVHLDLNALRSLAFVVIVFGNQATTYTNRERRHLWSSKPSTWVLVSSAADILIATSLACMGIAMAPLSFFLVIGTLGAAAAFAVLFDFVKVPVFRYLAIN
jgi:H+-transporting ATPase